MFMKTNDFNEILKQLESGKNPTEELADDNGADSGNSVKNSKKPVFGSGKTKPASGLVEVVRSPVSETAGAGKVNCAKVSGKEGWLCTSFSNGEFKGYKTRQINRCTQKNNQVGFII